MNETLRKKVMYSDAVFIKLWSAATRRLFRGKKALQKLYQTLNE
jgi:hypothetical protein